MDIHTLSKQRHPTKDCPTKDWISQKIDNSVSVYENNGLKLMEQLTDFKAILHSKLMSKNTVFPMPAGRVVFRGMLN